MLTLGVLQGLRVFVVLVVCGGLYDVDIGTPVLMLTMIVERG